VGGRRELAVFLAALVYAIVSDAFLATPLARAAGALGIPASVPRVLVGSIGIVACYAAIARVIAVVETWPLRGTWVLRSDTGEYGIATFPVRRGGPSYVADLYRSPAEIGAALRREPGAADRCFARLRSISMDRVEDGFTVRYEIRRAVPNYAPRKGILDIAPAAGTRELRGFWHSTAQGGPGTEDANSGAVTFLRPESFRAEA